MSAEQNVSDPNAASTIDAQNLAAELKGETQAPADGAPSTDAEEARIIEAASKLGETSEKSEEKTDSKPKESDSRNGGRGYKKNYSNAKFDPSTQKVTDDPIEIRKQVEFYFSDSNLPTDKFLLAKVGGSANNAVPLELLHTFSRMRRFQPFSAVVEAVRSSEVVELTDNDTCVRRKTPLPESVTAEHDPKVAKVFEDQAMSRSIYAKGFGREEPSTQFDIEAFFAPYGPTNAIRLRRADDKSFKGSVFVEFESEEKQKAFLSLDPKPQWKGEDLLVKSKKEYCEEKMRDIEAGRVKPSNRNRGGFRGRGRGGRGRGRGRGRGGDKRGGDDRDWRQRRDDDQKKGFNDSEPRRETQKDASGVPVVQSSVDDGTSGQKRTRDEESGANGDHPAKKVDVKED